MPLCAHWRSGPTTSANCAWSCTRLAGVPDWVVRWPAMRSLAEAVRPGRRKVVVELAADQHHALAMFGSLGFTGEALLRDHIRDRSGELHDLVMLAHFVEGTWASIQTIGLADELGLAAELAEGSPQ